jgi:hypothetical protein
MIIVAGAGCRRAPEKGVLGTGIGSDGLSMDVA